MTDHHSLAYGRKVIVEDPPFPDPELMCHVLADGCCPKKAAVTSLAECGRLLGWTVQITHARGCFPHATTGRPSIVKDSLAVRMWRDRDWATAVYVSGASWTWDYVYRWTVGTLPRKLVGITALQATLA